MRSLVVVEHASLYSMVQASGDPHAGRVRLVDVTTTPAGVILAARGPERA